MQVFSFHGGYMRHIYIYTCGTICFTRHSYLLGKSHPLSRSTRRASSSKSSTRNSARCSPITISGSGATTSVHCSGTEQTDSSSVCSSKDIPYRLCRSPTQTSCRPLNGWNGCVMHTRRVDAIGAFAFWIELQAVVQGTFRVVAEWQPTHARSGSSSGAVAAGRWEPGCGSRAGMAAGERVVIWPCVFHLRSILFSATLQMCLLRVDIVVERFAPKTSSSSDSTLRNIPESVAGGSRRNYAKLGSGSRPTARCATWCAAVFS